MTNLAYQLDYQQPAIIQLPVAVPQPPRLTPVNLAYWQKLLAFLTPYERDDAKNNYARYCSQAIGNQTISYLGTSGYTHKTVFAVVKSGLKARNGFTVKGLTAICKIADYETKLDELERLVAVVIWNVRSQFILRNVRTDVLTAEQIQEAVATL